jgi:hypothetical protein
LDKKKNWKKKGKSPFERAKGYYPARVYVSRV